MATLDIEDGLFHYQSAPDKAHMFFGMSFEAAQQMAYFLTGEDVVISQDAIDALRKFSIVVME